LLTMGYRALSIAPNMIPTTKSLIRKLDLAVPPPEGRKASAGF